MRALPRILLVAGPLVVAAGVLLLATAPSGGGYGWTAYSPLSDTAYLPPHTWPSRTLAGVLAAAGGAGTGAGVALLRRGRSAPRVLLLVVALLVAVVSVVVLADPITALETADLPRRYATYTPAPAVDRDRMLLLVAALLLAVGAAGAAGALIGRRATI